LIWQISQSIVHCLFPIVSTCVLNQTHGCWFINDALHSAISMNLKLKEENQIVVSFENLMDDDSIVIDELSLFVSNIRREVINILDFFPFFFKDL
jgi:hypothetical protein